MVKLSDEMAAEMKKMKVFYLATASKDGTPNVVPIGMLMLKENMETVWIIDNFMDKTLENLKENPYASFSVYNEGAQNSYQIKGKIKIVNSGADYEKAVEFAHSKKAELPAKNLLVMTIDRVYSVKPGPTAGKLILC